jgi:hypothetical protein
MAELRISSDEELFRENVLKLSKKSDRAVKKLTAPTLYS